MSTNEQPDKRSDATVGSQQTAPTSVVLSPSPPVQSSIEEKQNPKKGFFERWKHEIEFAGLLGLIFYCVVNWLEWRTFDSERRTMEKEFQTNQIASVQQIGEMQKQIILDERAWVAVSKVDIDNSESGFIKFITRYSNTGKTPALKMEIEVFSEPSTNYIPILDMPPNPRISSALVAPNGDGYTYIRHPVGIIKQIGNFYLFGTVWYNDIFGTSHWSQFCYWVTCDTNMTITVGPAAIHNSCDDAQTNQTN